MMRRVLVIADPHCDASSRFDEWKKIAAWTVDQCLELDIDLVLISGDVFERKSNPEERNAVAAWLRDLAECAPVVMIRGNHDAVGDLAIFSKLNARKEIIVEEQAGFHTVNGFAVAALAWPRKAELLAAIGVPMSAEESSVEAQKELRNVFMNFGLQFDSLEPGIAKIFLGHVSVRGCVTSTGQPMVGMDMEVSLEDLSLAKADCYALGHIHKGQSWQINGAPVIYPGSPRRTAFGEIETKNVVVLEFEEGKLSNWYPVETPAAPMILLETNFDVMLLGSDGAELTGYGDLTLLPDDLEYAGAEIRLRYHVDSDKQELAKRAANDRVVELLAMGAVSVKVESIVHSTTRARTPEVTTAKTLVEKLAVLWAARNQVPEQTRANALFSKVSQVENEIGFSAANRSHSSRLNTLRISDIGPFGSDVFIDFDKLNGVLVAVTGANGQGKSTLLECWPGAMYRSLPTRGSLASLATTRNAYIEIGYTNGARYNIRQTVDSISKKGESLVTDAAGNAVTVTGQVREFDLWSDQKLPPEEIFFSSVFAAQKSGGFLEMKPSDRKGVLLRLLGVEQLEELAAKAREHKAATSKLVAELNGKLSVVRSMGISTEDAEIALRDAEIEQQRADASLEEAQRELGELQVEATAAVESTRKLAEYRKQWGALDSRKSKVEADIADLEKRIANNKEVLARGTEIEESLVKAEVLQKEIDEQQVKLTAVQMSIQRCQSELQAEEKKSSDANRRILVLRESIGRLQVRLAEKDKIEAAKASLGFLGENLRKLESRVADTEGSLRELKEQRLDGANDRIVFLRIGLGRIADYAEGPIEIASETLANDDLVVTQHENRPGQIAAAESELKAAMASLNEARTAMHQAEMLAAGAKDLELWQRDSNEAKEDVSALESDVHAAGLRIPTLREEAERLNQTGSATKRTVSTLSSSLDALSPLLAQVERLRSAKVRVEELEGQVSSLREAHSELRDEIEQMGSSPIELETVYLGTAESKVGRLKRTATEAFSTVSLAQAALTNAQNTSVKVAEIEAELTPANSDLVDWTRLADDLGRDGLQALEVDAAGPELSGMVNDLLQRCFGSRFTISIETTRQSADNKKQIEGCEVRVIDTERGREGNVETLSGGEGSIVGVAFSLALTMLACQRDGIQGPTLVLDETGYLDVENARRYIVMLRRAAEILHPSKILFVSHSPEIQELADATLVVSNGQVTVGKGGAYVA